MLGRADADDFLEEALDRDDRAENAVGVGGQEVLSGQGFRQEADHLVTAVLLHELDHRLHAGGDAVPGEGGAGVFPGGLRKAYIPGNDDVLLPCGVIVVVRTGMAAREGAEIVLDVEGLQEIDMLPGYQLEDEGRDAGADVGFRYEDGDVLVEPGVVEAGPAARHAEGRLVDVVIDHHVDVVLLGHLLQGEGRLDAAAELVLRDVVHDLVSGGEVPEPGVRLGRRERPDDVAVVGIGEVMDLGADLRKEVVIVEIGGPHGLVHVGHQADIGAAEDGAGLGGAGIDADLFRNLRARAHDDLDVLPRDAADGAGGLQRADEGAGTEVIDEIVLVEGRLEGHPVPGDIGEQDRNLRHVPEEADPGEIFAPGEELHEHEVHFLVVEQGHGLFGVFTLVGNARPDEVEEVQARHDFLDGLVLPLPIGAALRSGEVLEAGGCDQQQAGFGLAVFHRFVHMVWILS